MKKTMIFGLCLGAAVALSSCYVQEVNVGLSETAQVVQVDKVKNHQFLWGLVEKKQDKAENHVGNAQKFRIRTVHTFWDGFLQSITYGIYTPSTTYYYKAEK